MMTASLRLAQAMLITCVLGAAQPSAAQVPRIATDIAPVHSLVASVMGDLGAPDLILQPGGDAHSNDLRPSAARALGRADIVFWMGPSLTPWLARSIDSISGNARIISLLAARDANLLPLRNPGDFTASPKTDITVPPEKDAHPDRDPHAWLDPENAIAWLGLIAGELAALDPANAAAYTVNAAVAQAGLQAEISRIKDRLGDGVDRSFVLYHDAFQYFENRFDLSAAAAISLGDAADPGPAHLAMVRDLVSSRAISCVLAEPHFNPEIVNSIFGGKSPKVIVLDVMGSELEKGPELYTQLLRGLADGFIACE